MSGPRFEVALVMAGGKGTRLWGPSKPFVEVCGLPLLEHVVRPASEVSRRVLITLSQEGLTWARSLSLPPNASLVVTNGAGYEADIGLMLETIRVRPLITLPGDLVGLTSDMLLWLAERSMELEEPVVSVIDRGRYVGISVFKDSRPGPWVDVNVEWNLVNVNTPENYGEALARCRPA